MKKDDWYWIAFHFKALNYIKTKIECKKMEIMRLPYNEQRNYFKRLVDWQIKYMEYHLDKALEHFPEELRIVQAQVDRDKDNKSLEHTFLKGSEMTR